MIASKFTLGREHDHRRDVFRAGFLSFGGDIH